MDLSFLLAGAGTSMTSLFAPTFLFLFLPASLILYAAVPKKAKKYVLLGESYLFFWFISGALLLYLVLSTAAIYGFGIWLEKIQERMKAALKALPKEERKAAKPAYIHEQRCVVALAVILHIGLLLVIKYSGFLIENVNGILSFLNSPILLGTPRYLMPIGISFFSLQAVSYVVDVYHSLIKADRNFFRLALFMSFFPQIVEGPIVRYSQTAEALWNVQPIRYQNLTMGLQRVVYGMMKKVVVADRLNPLVQAVFDQTHQYDGGIIALGAIAYTVQLYMDFSGAMDAVVGIAQIFGITMPENFRRPFFSKTISEFWMRWHISLGSWFKDYIFYPITASKRMKNLTSSARKKIGNHFGPLIAGSMALFCVWFCNGLWHGAAWSFIFFGMYHFVLILLGNMIGPAVKKVNGKLHLRAESRGYRYMQIVRTAILVVIGELFFRAVSVQSGFNLCGRMFTTFSFTGLSFDTMSKLGIDVQDLIIVGITLVFVFIVSLLNEKGISVREKIAAWPIVWRWVLLYALILYIVIFGAYGFGYIPVDPMYAQF